jgi:hypothetical protein
MPLMTCRRCRIDVVWPESLTLNDKALFADTARSSRVRAMQVAHSTFDIDLRQAKALSMHVTSARGKCNRCRRPIRPGEVSVCEQCNAVNLDW